MSSRRIWSQRVSFHLFRRTKPSDALLPNTSLKTGPSLPKDWPPNAVPKKEQANNVARGNTYPQPRWYNHLDPTIEKKGWTKKDEELLLALHKEHGNKWTIIADKMTGRYFPHQHRSDNSIKNYFYSTVRRNLRRMGKLLGSKNSTGLMR